MASNDYLVLYLTAENCGVCQRFRGNGIIGNKKAYMTYQKLFSILKLGVTFFNIHYSVGDGKNGNIVDISKISFNKKNNEIVQEKGYKHGNHTRVITIRMDEKENPRVTETITATEDKNNDPIKWETYIENHIPKKLENYAGLYAPCLLILKKKEWLRSLKNGTPMLGITNASYTIEVDGDFMISKRHDHLNMRQMKPEDLLTDLENGKIKFEAITEKDKNIPNETKEKKVNFSNDLNYRLIYYDDPE